MTYIIYKVTNIVNGKIYIGKTNNFKKRKREHTRYDVNDNCYFHKALNKYGENNFKWEIIDTANSYDEINELEKHYIKLYNSYKPNGYNLTLGGDGGSMWNAKPIVALDLNGKYIKEYVSAGQAQKEDGYISDKVIKCCHRERKTHKGTQFMYKDEYTNNGGTKYIPPQRPKGKEIIQMTSDGKIINTFVSVAEASRMTNISRTAILGVIAGRYRRAGGYFWIYKENSNNCDIPEEYKRPGIKIYQLDKTTNKIINSFNTIKEAGNCLGVSYKCIWKVIDKPTRSAYGYKWVTQNQYDNTVLT